MKPRPPSTNIHRVVMAWYRRVGRDLPWRRTRDPYAIVVSEVMLQQTQVDRVIPKFIAWRRAWPTTRSLARAPLSEVLKLWSGLGYNSRAMRLRSAAREVIGTYKGRWPRTVAELQALPGFGPYTAAAVATFAYQQRVPVIDTNIRRVIGRIFFGVTGAPNEKTLQTTVEKVLPTTRPDLWNHALMDLGAMVCVARKPKCEECPVKNLCRAYPAILTTPTTPKKKPQPTFESTDRFWRGRILAAVVTGAQLTPNRLITQLRKLGDINVVRMNRLLDDLSAEGLIQKHQGKVTLSA